MPGLLTNFKVEGLHGKRTFNVALEDNKLILVGENGTGKSTIANLIYIFLTRQWRRMFDYNFEKINAIVDSNHLSISLKDLRKWGEGAHLHHELYNKLSLRRIHELEAYLNEISFKIPITESVIRETGERLGLPASLIYEYYVGARHGKGEMPKELKKADECLKENIRYQVLFLPTYRRIEQDLKYIFPKLADDIKSGRESIKQRPKSTNFIELVEFGMQDVEQLIQQKMAAIKDNVRNGLNALTGSYLKDVIQGEYRTIDFLPKFKELNESTINSIFSRIPKAILPESEQDKLKIIIKDIRETNHIVDEDKVVAHFLIQLFDLHKKQQEDEKDIREFIHVCDNYLARKDVVPGASGKAIVYDNLNFEIFVTQEYNSDSQPDRLPLQTLSSGEKQIISLFSHIYLSGASGYFIIIDEPELSLSVPWQKRFLPDILDTGKCDGLLAVTHSPFIFDNKLSASAHSIEEFIHSANYVS